MKKSIKIILPAVAGLISVAVWVFTLIMIDTVNSEKIFFLNSELGAFYASAYRIFAVISGVILIAWIIIAAIHIPRIIKSIKLKIQSKKSLKGQYQNAYLANSLAEGLVAVQSPEASANDIGAIPEVISEAQTTAIPTPAVQPDTEEKMVACVQCGKFIEAEARFCPFCGIRNQIS